MCGHAKRSQYNFIVDSFNCKNKSILDFTEVIKFIKRNCDIQLFDGNSDYIDEACHEIFQSLFIVAHTKYKPMQFATMMAEDIRKKFYSDITLTMTDDEGCNEYRFYKGIDAIKTKKAANVFQAIINAKGS
jgi:hypothetical protein